LRDLPYIYKMTTIKIVQCMKRKEQCDAMHEVHDLS
jgi:hypothetical protein